MNFHPIALTLAFFALLFYPLTSKSQNQKNEVLEISAPSQYQEKSWIEKELLRKQKEEELLKKYSNYITKNTKNLVKNDNAKFREKNARESRDIQYLLKTDSGKIYTKNYCDPIAKCMGYNDYLDELDEYRLIDVKQDNALFYESFYTLREVDAIEVGSPFLLFNLHSGEEIHLLDPKFSPDEKFIVDIRSIPYCAECTENGASGFNIDIYAIDDKKNYVLTSRQEMFDSDQFGNSYFLNKNKECGSTPHFHSWKNNNEIRISMLEPQDASKADRVILKYDSDKKNWSCSKTQEKFP